MPLQMYISVVNCQMQDPISHSILGSHYIAEPKVVFQLYFNCAHFDKWIN